MSNNNTNTNFNKKINKEKSDKKVKSITFPKFETNYQSSESVVRTMVDKIISLTVRRAFADKINRELNTYCFDFLHSQLDSLFETSYISYTNNSKNENTTPLFYKSLPPPNTIWVEIQEPTCIETDRCEGAFINYKEIPKKEDEYSHGSKKSLHSIKMGKHKTSQKNVNNGTDRKLPSLLSKKAKIDIKIVNNPIIENNNNNSEDVLKRDDKKKPSSKVTLNKISNNEISNNNLTSQNINNKVDKNSNDENNQKKRKPAIIDLPSYEIPGIEDFLNYESFDPPNIIFLRKEREEEIIKKNKEKLEKIKQQNKINLKQKEEQDKANRKVRPFDSNKFSFDSNGNIIRFKQFKLENLTKDFISARNLIRENDNKAKQQTKGKNAKKQVQPEEEIIRNPDDAKSVISVFEKTANEKMEDKILPSGSNFNIISPNVGVIIKENQNIKEGGMEFNKYFNKYSMSDYDKMLNDYIPMMNKNIIKTQLDFNNKSQNIASKNVVKKSINESMDNANLNLNSSATNYEYKKENNPLLTTTEMANDFDNSGNNYNTSYLRTSGNINSVNNVSNNPLMTSYNLKTSYNNNNNFNKSNDRFNNTLNDYITMTKLGMTSVKMEIDNVKDLYIENNNIDFNNMNNLRNTQSFNLFKHNFKSPLRTLQNNNVKNSMADFDKKILANKRWGNDIGDGGGNPKQYLVYSKHHTKRQALQELGSNILNSIKLKLPRDRKVEVNIK